MNRGTFRSVGGHGGHDLEPLGPRHQRIHGPVIERNARGARLAPACETLLAGQTHGLDARDRRIAAAGRGDEASLSHETVGASERGRIQDLEVHRSAPSSRPVGPAVAREPLAEAFVPVLASAHRQQRSPWVSEQHARVVGRLAAAVIAQLPGKRLPSLCSRQVRPLVVIDALMSIRIGSPSVGIPTATGSGVNKACTPP